MSKKSKKQKFFFWFLESLLTKSTVAEFIDPDCGDKVRDLWIRLQEPDPDPDPDPDP